MSDVSCSPVVLSTQGMGGAQKAVLWPALPVHLCAHGNGRRQQEERKEPEDCERTEKERSCPPILLSSAYQCILYSVQSCQRKEDHRKRGRS